MTAGPPTTPATPLEGMTSPFESKAARLAVLAQMASSEDETVRELYRLHQEIVRLLDEMIERKNEERRRHRARA